MLLETYIAYFVISFAITIWVGHSLSKNGRIFLIENFKNNIPLADSVNSLLLTGFYLVNFGFICLTLKYGDKPSEITGTIEFLASKVGFAIMVLGGMHFFNMRMLGKMRHIKMFQPVEAEAAPSEKEIPKTMALPL